MDYFDEIEVRKTISTLIPDGGLFEVRIVRGKQTVCGYFKNVDNLISQLRKQDLKDTNVYIVANSINDACYSRKQREIFLHGDVAGTSDNDVIGREWLMVDIDPIRPAKTSSTKEEIEHAWEKSKKIARFLRESGFEKPIMAFSGNGAHILYKVQMKCNKENTALLKSFLETIAALFNDEQAKIDTVNYNESRGVKLYGTLAQKGLNDEQRRHRLSKIIEIPQEVRPTDKAYFEKICNIIEKEDNRPSRYNNYGQSFNIEEWMQRYGIEYRKTGFSDRGTKYLLAHCPFDENHKAPDSMIVTMPSGAIGFKCLHNSCADKRWQDVRMLYEPDAYTRRQEQIHHETYSRRNKDVPPPPPPPNTVAFFSATDILNMPDDPEEYIKTGISMIDRFCWGLKKKNVSVWSGLRGAAKSTVLTEVCLNAINQGYRAAIFSGEMRAKSFLRWLMQQAAGKAYVEKGLKENEYNVPIEIQREIAHWMDGKFYLYNNKYGNAYTRIKEAMIEKVKAERLDLVVLDNLMAMDIHDLSDSKWDAQTRFVLEVHDIAETYNIHVAFVAHPRKSVGFLRLNDISGTADLANAVDEAFLVHRKNKDFDRLFAQDMGKIELSQLDDATNVLEIAKDRNQGTQDVFVPLWYEYESKRLKNDKAESVRFGWQETVDYGFEETDDNPFV